MNIRLNTKKQGNAEYIFCSSQQPYTGNYFLAKRISKEIHIYICRFISDPFIDGLRTELHELESKKQEAIDKAIAEKTAKGKK